MELDKILLEQVKNGNMKKMIRDVKRVSKKTMNDLEINKKKKRALVDTISAVYILEVYLNKMK